MKTTTLLFPVSLLLTANCLPARLIFILWMAGGLLLPTASAQVTAEFEGTPLQQCGFPLEVSFTDQSTGYVIKWYWEFGDGATSMLQNPTHIYTDTGKFTVSLNVDDGMGNNDWETKIEYIKVFPVPSVNPFLQGGEICLGENIDIGAGFVVVGGTPPYTYSWSPSEALDNPSVLNAIAYADSTDSSSISYTLLVVDVNNCLANAFFWLDILSLPVADFISNPAGKTVSFTNQSTDADSYLWSFGDSDTSTLKDPVHTYTNNGNYNVLLFAINECGADTATDTLAIAVGINEQSAVQNAEVILYPNPSSGDFKVSSFKFQVEDATVSIYDLLGQEVSVPLIRNSDSFVISSGELVSGIYFLKITSKDFSETKKLIKQ